MDISEQVNYLRRYITSDENLYDALHEAADTIESLSAKLADMERSAEDCSGGWIPAKIKNDNFICDKKLKNYYGVILITYETTKKRRYTKPVLCNYGYISKKIGGEITAWRFMPEPYHEP